MKRSEILSLIELGPNERALAALNLGARLATKRRKRPAKGRVPRQVLSETMGIANPLLKRLHGAAATVPRTRIGLRQTGTLKTIRGEIEDLVLTTQARKQLCRQALLGEANLPEKTVYLRQLALGMLDRQPIPRLCSAYAYWQATQAADAVVPILAKGLESEDEEEFTLAATCMRQVRPRRLGAYVGGPEDDESNSPTLPVEPSMTVIVHGTFAKDRDWYQPLGDFYEYIKNQVYPDLYSGADFFYWSGGYSHTARAHAATKLVSWCQHHPTDTLRLIAHSHGANVVNIATTMGLQACTLIHLSPPVHDRYMPNMTNISSARFFTIRPRNDLIVAIDGGRPHYKGTPVAASERQKICAFFGHSKSHNPRRWQKKNVPVLTRSVCP